MTSEHINSSDLLPCVPAPHPHLCIPIATFISPELNGCRCLFKVRQSFNNELPQEFRDNVQVRCTHQGTGVVAWQWWCPWWCGAARSYWAAHAPFLAHSLTWPFRNLHCTWQVKTALWDLRLMYEYLTSRALIWDPGYSVSWELIMVQPLLFSSHQQRDHLQREAIHME